MADFAFAVRPAQRRQAAAGDVVHVYRVGGDAVVVRATAIGSLSTSCTKGKPRTCTAAISAMATDRWSVDLVTGVASLLFGTPGMAVTGVDGSPDRYAIQIGPPDDHDVGVPTPVQLLAGSVRVG